MKAIKFTAILVVSLFVFNSCTKQVAGPAGPQGVQGAQGSSAAYSVTIDSIPASAWPLSANGQGAYTVTLNNVSALSNPNFSIVEVYCSTSYSNLATWQELGAPNIFQKTDLLTFDYTVNQVTMEYFFTSAPVQQIYVKIIVINQP